MKTQWTVIAIDETRYWSEDIVAKAGRLYGIYLYDANRHVYCCEITPSYELELIETVWTHNTQNERLQMDVLEGDAQNEKVCYYHCSGVNHWDDKWKQTLTNHDVEYEEVDDTGKVWDQLRDDMMEYLRGNQVVPVGVPCEVE